MSICYCMVCVYVREDNSRALASGLSSRTYAQSYNNCLIAPACMCTLCIVSYLMKNIGISLKGAIKSSYNWSILLVVFSWYWAIERTRHLYWPWYGRQLNYISRGLIYQISSDRYNCSEWNNSAITILCHSNELFHEKTVFFICIVRPQPWPSGSTTEKVRILKICAIVCSRHRVTTNCSYQSALSNKPISTFDFFMHIVC